MATKRLIVGDGVCVVDVVNLKIHRVRIVSIRTFAGTTDYKVEGSDKFIGEDSIFRTRLQASKVLERIEAVTTRRIALSEVTSQRTKKDLECLTT